MRKPLLTSLILSALFVAPISSAISPNYSLEDLPKLAAESQHVTASKRIASYFTRYHYSRVELDEAMSEQIFDRYFQQLDYNRMFMLQSDVDEFTQYNQQFHTFLLEGKLDVAYAIYQRSLERRYQRYAHALALLDDAEFDFEVEGERFYYDRSEEDWATSEQELDAMWEQRIKHDALNLALAGREQDEIIENLERRYQSAIQRLTQSQSEDAFATVMNAFARSVEAHTSYLSPRNAERFQQNMNLQLEGIGAVLQAEYDYTVIRSLVPGGPADQSGRLAPDDRIIAVAQGDKEFVDVIGWRLDDVVDLITGPKGSTVRLQVLKESQGSGGTPETVEIVRDKVRLEDREARAEVKVPDEGAYAGHRVGVIEIPGFYNNLTADVLKLVNELKEDNIEALIIDLRGNGGGSLSESIYLTGLFIEEGPVVQVRDSSGRVEVNRDSDGRVFYEGPLTVLVDRFSASASEIFAAAIQDYNRGIVLGEQTFGKGTVQQHRGLQRRFDFYSNPLGSIQYTIAKFYRIDGGSTQHRGVVPDILFPSALEPDEFGEARAENALPWDQIDAVEYERFEWLGEDLLSTLTERHTVRIADDPEFAYVYQDIERFRERRDRNYVSLVQSEREAESDADTERRLRRINERLARAGKEPVEAAEDADERYREPDPYLDEALRITLDFVAARQQD
ncbi:carboxy terminal-processing peptidase [Aliidiomarina maris]|uniref:Carboxy terminal-processing peptidase n=1 Tax=Aliidiomarina maris TaxID=531312 RepID=A0A327X6Y9_9GAMM|nr:carboxy terminal-processing peptidase [Aliidiomarina maris]RAJ98946.1 S41A family C-terminal processing peptidase-1 [Aliidiomarina maris]RUO25089.1 carboxy terminal-processing peptidase [Aliidiomarina maris]